MCVCVCGVVVCFWGWVFWDFLGGGGKGALQRAIRIPVPDFSKDSIRTTLRMGARKYTGRPYSVEPNRSSWCGP